ncbi:TAXI family TRAP transporter solute-binding subunit [Aquisalimonas sp. 2447]|uniref:TAXI family TRAP transporter solute-binding subunit n=1 Tax=Aquisalimonas sp. 2447 TaxID=2740807 RepID=UPI0014323B4C|nr:TAXI family TRAP transporter solute-binding subunit [Aquisalimonas sp. 2447]QIT54593.1 TAXI family TRAP transporter solute-binding subunit [Aquisalimonas sp. 2447]
MQSTYRVTLGALGGIAAAALAANVQAQDIELPGTVVWSAYPTGTSGYAQSVAIGSILQNEYGTNLRVIPGRNDVSRLSPLRSGRVNFSAGGSEAVYAQEGMLNFGEVNWGPQPLRIAMWNISDGCSFTMATGADAGIETAADLEGKRVTWVQGAPSLNNATRALLSYADLTWDDVERVDVGGYGASIEAVIENRADAVGGSCNSAPFLRIESSPRGLRFVTFPHDDQDAIDRVRARLPWYVPHVATDGPTIDPDEGIEVFTSPYPMLATRDEEDADLVYNMVKAMHRHYDQYKDNAPGAIGWAMDRQGLEEAFVPYHEGAIRYFEEIGVWTDAAQENQENNLKRQEVLMAAWERYIEDAPTDRDAFQEGWMTARFEALQEHDLVPIAESW